MPATAGTLAPTDATCPVPGPGLEKDLAVARNVLRVEAAALEAMALSLDDSFGAALDALGSVDGRVVVTGMGKSGHVAHKIAATFASTGTPSLFVHPGEASHGDLGMVTRADALLALSNSGKTSELADILAYAARIGIPVVGMTARRESPLADAASVALVLPVFEEACPLGLAPTTSTTMMLALGDALAVALLERRGFSAEDFAALHPGGALGRKLVRVRDIMHVGDAVPLVGIDTGMADAIVTMSAKSFGCVGVQDATGSLIGIVTDGDLRRNMAPDLLAWSVRTVMTKRPRTIRAAALAAEAVALMNERAITSLFITEGGVPVGIVHLHDCLRAGIG